MTRTSADAIETCKASVLRGYEFRLFCMRALNEIPGYDWSGVYRLEGETLVLDAFAGAETAHTHILVGEGVCGTAVAHDKNQVIEDVTQLDNYLSCSLDTKAEIVVLIKKDSNTIGQIDVDSHQRGAFSDQDEQFLDSMAALIADRWEQE